MPLTHTIIHKLDTTLPEGEQLQFRDQPLQIDEMVEGLVARLKSSFLGRISREHGSFEGNGSLPSELKRLLSAEVGLEQISSQLGETFLQLLVKEGVALSANLLFCIEEGMNSHFMHLFVLQDQQSIQINNQLEVSPTYSVDVGQTLFGIKVDLREWREHEQYAYLSLLPPRGNQLLTQAFYQLCDFRHGIDKAEATLTFLDGVDAYATTLPEEQVEPYRSQVVEYCMEQESQDEPVELSQLARTIDGIDSGGFVSMMEGYQPPDLGGGIPMDRRSLSRYLRFSGRERDLSISFSSTQLNDRVRYDPGSDTLHISGLPKALRQQLLGHLEEG